MNNIAIFLLSLSLMIAAKSALAAPGDVVDCGDITVRADTNSETPVRYTAYNGGKAIEEVQIFDTAGASGRLGCSGPTISISWSKAPSMDLPVNQVHAVISRPGMELQRVVCTLNRK